MTNQERFKDQGRGEHRSVWAVLRGPNQTKPKRNFRFSQIFNPKPNRYVKKPNRSN